MYHSTDLLSGYKERIKNLNGLARDPNEQTATDSRTNNPSN